MISPRTKRFMRPQKPAPHHRRPHRPAPIGQVSDETANRRDAEWLSDARWHYETPRQAKQQRPDPRSARHGVLRRCPPGAVLGRHVDCLPSDVLTGAALTLVNGSDSM